ncbi:DUF2252 domain-containing protein [Paenibacillus sp. HN-1]|uniref:DUF2252 domain-containing protein n=1 Tax=Paenibacillus TaxID=44249 RepID=UPI001CAA0DBA|nr:MULTISPECIES: DUF2252 family protein [Paenibacillus]MBY9078361.1 DUF2252 domain-containing protein [Paenibacillus sp. CGMCC 1.18879]MBY9087306.1 DUF2252 domain-containing protein [Paenibacillus sinensis]
MIDRQITEGIIRTRTKLRRNTLISIFEEFDRDLMKLDDARRAEKYAKMSLSPFSFFRGSAYLFYFDCQRQYFPYHSSPERPTWIQGDLHFENFGAFRNEDGELVYDVNDFDEGYLGSYLYDLIRMSVSIVLVCRELGYTPEEQRKCVEGYVAEYHERITAFCGDKEDPGKYVVNENEAKGPVKKLLRKLEKRQGGHFLDKVTSFKQEGRIFLENDELREPEAGERADLERAWSFYLQTLNSRKSSQEHYTIKDVAVKEGSGTASIGLKRYYILIEGQSHKGAEDTVLEAKEVRVPIPAYFLPYLESFWDFFGHQGKRVTATQQAMHHKADPYLGFLTMGERHFYVRERSPYKKGLRLTDLESLQDMEKTLTLMARLTAKMHARADSDVTNGLLPYHSEREIAAAMGEDHDGISRFISRWAVVYGDQVEKDYAMFKEWAALSGATTP